MTFSHAIAGHVAFPVVAGSCHLLRCCCYWVSLPTFEHFTKTVVSAGKVNLQVSKTPQSDRQSILSRIGVIVGKFLSHCCCTRGTLKKKNSILYVPMFSA